MAKPNQANRSNIIIPGFQTVEPEAITSLQISSTGLEKTGKTHFAMTMPDPLAYLRVSERGDRGVVDKFARSRRILSASIAYTRKASKPEHARLWDECRRYYDDALESGIRSLVIDTATGMWELCRLARFGKLTQVKPHHYGPVNAEFQGLIDAAFEADVNVCFIHKSKKRYKNDQWDGGYERAGFGDMDFLCPVVIEHFKDKKKIKGVRVLECRYEQELEGAEFGEEMDFAGLACEIFPDTEREDWE